MIDKVSLHFKLTKNIALFWALFNSKISDRSNLLRDNTEKYVNCSSTKIVMLPQFSTPKKYYVTYEVTLRWKQNSKKGFVKKTSQSNNLKISGLSTSGIKQKASRENEQTDSHWRVKRIMTEQHRTIPTWCQLVYVYQW